VDGKVNMKQIESKDANLWLAYSSGKAKNTTESREYFFDEGDFKEMLNLERKLSQRSMRPLILLRLDISCLTESALSYARHNLMKAFATGIRDTDIRGWYKRGSVVGILFTDIHSASPSLREILFRRVMACLARQIDQAVLQEIKVTFLLYEEGKPQGDAIEIAKIEHYAVLVKNTARLNFSATLKSLVDLASSFLVT
jgi:hypothetical protein